MGQDRGWVNREIGPTGLPLEPLSEGEVRRQREVSGVLRKDLEEILAINIRNLDLDSTNTALMLSGGMESSAILFSLIKLGVRPQIISYYGGGDGPSLDFKKAQSLAEHYNLPFHPVVLPEDPELFYEYTKNAVFNRNLETRPDIEVSFLYYNIYQKAKEIGVTFIYSGVDEGNLIGLGRKYEMPGRYGQMSSQARLLNHAKLISSNNEQKYSFASEANLNGLVLLTPMSTWGSILTLADVPFRLSNLPKQKSIMSVAYGDELDETGLVIQVSPMQVRDASPRQIYNDYVRRSEGVRRDTAVAGVHGVDTAQKWYNFLKKQAGLPIARSSGDINIGAVIGDAQEVFVNHVFTGAPIPEDMEELGVSGAGIDTDYLDGMDLGASVDLLSEGAVEDYAPETLNLTDCFGTPLGSPYAMDLCPRARAGLCNHNPKAGEVTGDKDDGSYDLLLCGLSRVAVDNGLGGEYRSAEYNHLWGFDPRVTDMHIELYEYIVARNKEIFDKRRQELLYRVGGDPYGNGTQPGHFRYPEGDLYPSLGTLDGYVATGPDGIDPVLFDQDARGGGHG